MRAFVFKPSSAHPPQMFQPGVGSNGGSWGHGGAEELQVQGDIHKGAGGGGGGCSVCASCKPHSVV